MNESEELRVLKSAFRSLQRQLQNAERNNRALQKEIARKNDLLQTSWQQQKNLRSIKHRIRWFVFVCSACKGCKDEA